MKSKTGSGDELVADVRATIMTLQEVARFLRVHPMTIYRLIQRGELPAARVGRNWRFRKDQLHQWLVEHEINSNHHGDKRTRASQTRRRGSGDPHRARRG